MEIKQAEMSHVWRSGALVFPGAAGTRAQRPPGPGTLPLPSRSTSHRQEVESVQAAFSVATCRRATDVCSHSEWEEIRNPPPVPVVKSSLSVLSSAGVQSGWSSNPGKTTEALIP